MRANWDQATALLLRHEGGYSTHRDDPGNWTGGKPGKGQLKGTKYGISASSFPHLDIARLSREQAIAIYKRHYWDAIRADELPHGIDHCVFDVAVNSGTRRAGILLQRALTALGQRVTIDGYIGDLTLVAVSETSAIALIDAICDARAAFLAGLKGWPKYKNGWMHRVAEVRDVSSDLAREALRSENDPAIMSLVRWWTGRPVNRE